jgi:hypothetical protein
MKKDFFGKVMGVLLLAVMALVCSCNGCAKTEKQDIQPVSLFHDYDGVVQDFTVGVAQIQALHRQTMFMTLGVEEYEWRNSKIVFNDSIKADNIDDLHVTDINDVFYYWDEQKGPQVQFINSNVKNGTQIPWPINDVWIEDDNLSGAPIKLTAEQVLMRLKEVNCPIPPAKSMSLRLPIGPCECNPQYVVGDVYDVLFIDAVTGEVSNWNPAFNPKKGVKGGDFGKPLGEWP